MVEPGSAPRSSHGNYRLPNPPSRNYCPPQPTRHHDSRHGSTHFGFNFSVGCVAPPLVTVAEPLYVQPPVVSAPIVVAPQPAVQVPTVQPALSAAYGVLLEGVVSRDDHIAPKSVMTVDGIILKIEDTDECPLDVDIELDILGHEQDFEDLPIGSRVSVYGQSGQLYHVDILAIDDHSETLRFAISQ